MSYLEFGYCWPVSVSACITGHAFCYLCLNSLSGVFLFLFFSLCGKICQKKCFAGLNRCGKSCRLRWTNYLRPDLKHEDFTQQEEELIVQFHAAIGSRSSLPSVFLFPLS